MDNFEKWGYSLLGILVLFYIMAMFAGMILAFPFGILGLILFAGIGLLFIKVFKERMSNKEDDYYANKVDK